MSKQGASGPNYSLIALIVIGAIFLIGFYYADRSSSPDDDMGQVSTTGAKNSPAMRAAAEKHQQAVASDNRPGFSGTIEDYLAHAEQVQTAKKLGSQGFSGSGHEYLEKGTMARSVKTVDGVIATGQSLDEYLASSAGTESTSADNQKNMTSTEQHEPATKPKQDSDAHGESFSGSIDAYLKQYAR